MIRSILISLILILTFNYIKSQNLSNYDFEDWKTLTSYENPLGWSTSNYSVFGVITFETVFKETTDVYSGESSIKLVTTEKNASGEDVKVVGLITLGVFDVNLATRQAVVKGGIPVIEKPSLLSGYYKYSTSGLDSCIMSIFLTKYDNNENKRDTVGIGVFTSSNESEWTLFEAPINYYSETDPDSLNIVILSSDTSIFDPGSTLLIDNLYIDGTVGVFNNLEQEDIKVYPNPAKDLLNIEIPIDYDVEVSLFNMIGVKVKNINVLNSKTINVSDLKPGIYFLYFKTNNRRVCKKIIIN